MGIIVKTSNKNQVAVDMGKEAIKIGEKAGVLTAKRQKEERKRPPKSLAEEIRREIDDAIASIDRDEMLIRWHKKFYGEQAHLDNN